MKKILLITGIICGFNVFHFSGQVTTDTLSVQLSDVEINATRTKLYPEMGRILTVIDKNEIERSAVRSIDELLDYVSGLDIRQRGGNGVQADISVRGGSFDQALILLNGINITDPQTGHFNLDIPIQLSDVSKVEILKGSSARMLGPNAFSGAINIITEEGTKSFLKAGLEAGSFGYGEQSVTTAFIQKPYTLLSLSHKSSDGYTDNTDFENSNIFLHSKLNSPKFGNIQFQTALQKKGFGANGFYSLAYPHQFESTQTLMAGLRWELIRRNISYHAQSYWRQHHDRFELFRNFEGAPSSYTQHNYHLTDVVGGKFDASVANSWGKITFGIEGRNEHIFSTVLGNEMNKTKPDPYENGINFNHSANRLLGTAFIDYAKIFDRWYVSAGGALSHATVFGTNPYGGFDIAFHPNNMTKIFFSSNTAVRLPTFTDLYYRSPTQISNPNLKPEHSTTWELGAGIQQKHWQADATTFYRKGKNIIDWVKEPDSTKWESRNLTEVNAVGLDMNLNYSFSNSFLQKAGLSYSFLQMDKNAENFDSKYALDYMKHKLIATLQHKTVKNCSLNWKLSFLDRAGNYTDFYTQQPVNYQPYFLLDMKGLWEVEKYAVYLDLNNIFDKTYADYGGIVQPGFNFTAGIKWKFK
jgi:vitamin B12 transporter